MSGSLVDAILSGVQQNNGVGVGGGGGAVAAPNGANMAPNMVPPGMAMPQPGLQTPIPLASMLANNATALQLQNPTKPWYAIPGMFQQPAVNPAAAPPPLAAAAPPQAPIPQQQQQSVNDAAYWMGGRG